MGILVLLYLLMAGEPTKLVPEDYTPKYVKEYQQRQREDARRREQDRRDVKQQQERWWEQQQRKRDNMSVR